LRPQRRRKNELANCARKASQERIEREVCDDDAVDKLHYAREHDEDKEGVNGLELGRRVVHVGLPEPLNDGSRRLGGRLVSFWGRHWWRVDGEEKVSRLVEVNGGIEVK